MFGIVFVYLDLMYGYGYGVCYVLMYQSIHFSLIYFIDLSVHLDTQRLEK